VQKRRKIEQTGSRTRVRCGSTSREVRVVLRKEVGIFAVDSVVVDLESKGWNLL